MAAYKIQLSARRDPIVGILQRIFQRVRRAPKRVVFAEGEEEQMIRAAVSFVHHKLGTAILIGREETVRGAAERAGIDIREGIEIHNARLSQRNADYADFLYARLQRKGYLFRDVQRLVNTDRNHFGACMVALGDADAHGLGRDAQLLDRARRRAPGDRPEARPPRHRRLDGAGARPPGAGRRHRRPRHADRRRSSPTSPRRRPASPSGSATRRASRCSPTRPSASRRASAPSGCARRSKSSTSAGSISSTTARWRRTWRSTPKPMAAYPFCRLSGPANVLVMPAYHSAAISTKMLQELGGSTVIGPLLVGLDKPVQIVSLGAMDSDIVNMAALAAFNLGRLTRLSSPAAASG